MPAAYLYRKNERCYEVIASKHLALGILSAEKFSAQTQSFSMANDDRLFLWSDGILEAENLAGEMFGEQRVQALFAHQPPEAIYDEINHAVNQFSEGNERSDDLSLVEMTMVDFSVLENLGFIAPKTYRVEPAHWSFSLQLQSDSLRFGDPLPLLQQMLVDLPGLRPHGGELFTALSELYSNALEHGVLKLDSQLKESLEGFSHYYQLREERLSGLDDGFIRFDIQYQSNDISSHLLVQVTDSGDGFDHKAMYGRQRPENYFGRGLRLIHAICHSVEYRGKGNQVRVEFTW